MQNLLTKNVILKTNYDIIIVGGGAAGFFSAINIAEKNPEKKICILERGKEVLTKVKVSGGGRCNITHAQFNPKELIYNYPRGEKELLGPFHTFMTGDTIEWFEKKGIPLKIEADGRVFPISNSSQSIIDCFLSEAKKMGINLLKKQTVKSIKSEDNLWKISTNNHDFTAKKIIVSTGSNPKMWNVLEKLGHTIVPPVPSLFTFNIEDKRLENCSGIVLDDVEIIITDTSFTTQAPLLITHWGLSGPAILKLSAFAAIELSKKNYQFKIQINFIQQQTQITLNELKEKKILLAKKTIINYAQYHLPKRFWKQLVLFSGIKTETTWAEVTNKQLEKLAIQLCQASFNVKGKSTFKEEFVTAGGILLTEINFKNFESKLYKNLYFAGEVLNIDAITGGFNFQNAWTGAYIIAKNINN